MKKYFYPVLLFICLLFTRCSSDAQPQQKISQFEKADVCDLLIDKSGVYHAVFRESPDYGKPTFIYYASSSNKGTTWTKPVNISNDNTGNGAGYPRIMQDASGRIYAIWKRYGTNVNHFAVPDVLLDGPGGYTGGTLFYKVLNGGAWSAQVKLHEAEGVQNSWFATLSSKGEIAVFWTEPTPELGKQTEGVPWYYCDYVRFATLNGTSPSALTDFNQPTPLPAGRGYPAEKNGAINLNGYIDKNTGSVRFVYEENPDGIQQIEYYDGKTQRVVYSYPKYTEGNTFHSPAKLLVDEKGNDHLIFIPPAKALESEQLWDINLATNQTNVLVSIQQPRVSIRGMQATQGPNGAMAVTFEAGTLSGNTEGFGLFYQGGTWKNVGLTNNASKEKFFSKEFIGLGGYRTSISTLTKYNSQFGSVAYDANGKKAMLMTIGAYWIGGAYSTNSPSVVFIPIDK